MDAGVAAASSADLPDRVATGLDAGDRALIALLLGGGARTVRELARAAGGRDAECAERLQSLLRRGLLGTRQSGGRTYWRLANPRIAQALAPEGVCAAESDAVDRRWHTACMAPLRAGRRCYGHLAGELGVAQLQALLRDGALRQDGDALAVTARGWAWLAPRGIAAASGRVVCRPCLDWSERRDHLGGALGRALLDDACNRGWLRAGTVPRALALTPRGRREYLPWLRGTAKLPA